GIAVGASRLARVHRQAEAGEPALAVFAEAAGDVEGQAHVVADLDPVHRLADLDHLALVFVSEDGARLEIGAAFVHVKVGATDVGAGDAYQHVGGFFYPGVGNLVDAHVAGAVEYHGFHGCTSSGLEKSHAGPAGAYGGGRRPRDSRPGRRADIRDAGTQYLVQVVEGAPVARGRDRRHRVARHPQ